MEDPENPGMILATTASTQARLYILGWLLQSIFYWFQGKDMTGNKINQLMKRVLIFL